MYEAEHLSRRESDSLIDSVIHVRIWLRYDMCNLISMHQDQFEGLIFRRTIDYDILDIAIRLIKDRLHCRENRASAVIGNGDY